MDNNKLTTTGGHVIEMKPFITGRQALELAKIKDDNTEERNVKISEKTIELVVVSFDGSTEGVSDKILDLPVAEYTEVIELVQEIATGKKKEASTPTT